MGRPTRFLEPEEVPENIRQFLDFDSQCTEFYSNHYQTLIVRTCKDCGERRKVPIANIRAKGDAYTARCSSCSCSWKNKNVPRHRYAGPEHPLWKGGHYEHPSGYSLVHLANFGPREQKIIACMTDKDKYIKKHRAVMALHLGRALLESEVVHHKDGNKANNLLSNLELRTTKTHGTGHGSPYYQLWQESLAEVDKLSKHIKELEAILQKGFASH